MRSKLKPLFKAFNSLTVEEKCQFAKIVFTLNTEAKGTYRK
jgi:hypothetical protein